MEKKSATIWISEQTHERVKAVADREKRSFSAQVELWLEEQLARSSKPGRVKYPVVAESD